MTLEDILHDEDLRRREFPVAAEKIFWAHAGVTALPRCVVEAMRHYVERCGRGDQEAELPPRFVMETRSLAARLLGGTPQEIALIGPTSVALSLVANGLDFAAGENVVFYPDDYPANVYPWQALQTRGVDLRPVQPEQLGQIGVQDIIRCVDQRTRLVALASAHFLSGHRLDLAAIGGFLRERRILFCVDGIQTLGAFRTSAAHCDFMAADAHKWLLGPLATGVLHVRREVQDRLRPTLLGWNNVACPDYIAREEMKFPPHAGRYEAGSANLVGIVGLNAALKLLLRLGIERIESRLIELGARVIRDMEQDGWHYLGTGVSAQRSGILSFTRPDLDLPALHSRLTTENMVISLRQTRDGARVLRLSPHFYNTGEEWERLRSTLRPA